MLRRHLDLPVYEDSIHPVLCSHSSKPMNRRGDHASICKYGAGVTHLHNTVRITFARQVFKPAGLAYALEEPFLIPNTELRPADAPVQPSPPPPGAPISRPTAYDITVRSPYYRSTIMQAARKPADAAEAGDVDKRGTLERSLRNALLFDATGPLPQLAWQFIPLSFDTLDAPSSQSLAVIEDHAKIISFRSHTSYATAKLRIQQCLSFALV